MKQKEIIKSIVTVIIMTLLNMNLYSQWEVKNVSEVGETIHELKFYNEEVGLAMGTDGLVLRTTDTGDSWERIETQIEGDIASFDFVSADTIFLVSNLFIDQEFETSIYKSENGGDDWEEVFMGEGSLSCIQFMSRDKGIASGSQRILRTENGGETWETVYDITLNDFAYGGIKKFEMLNDSIGFATLFGRNLVNDPLFSSLILKTADGGVTWTELFDFDLYYSRPNAIDFINPEVGFTSGEIYTYKTIDGGMSWDTVMNLSNAVDISMPSANTIFTVNRPNAYIVGTLITSFAISKSIDAGNTWEGELRDGAHLETVFFLTDSIGYVAGDYAIIMKTETCGGEIIGDYPWDLFTKLNEIKINNDFEIYPNPARSIIKLRQTDEEVWGKADLRIRTIDGAILWSSAVDKLWDIEIDISNFLSGTYVFEIESESKIRYAKFIKVD